MLLLLPVILWNKIHRPTQNMRHRGKHSNDDQNFAPKWQPIFAGAATDLAYLLGRGYGGKSALALVGNRYQLNKRQQRALSRMTCADHLQASRQAKRLSPAELKGQTINVDGYNVLIGLEAALSGAYIFVGQDGCHRDIASVHGTYKRVEETEPALQLLHETFTTWKVKAVHWYFDAPVSNSGRLKTRLYELAALWKAPWTVELVYNPDRELVQKGGIGATVDGWIIDQLEAYIDVVGAVIQSSITDAQVWNAFA